MKGLLVLLSMLAVLAIAGTAIGYAVFGDDFYDIITAAEARLKTAQREAQDLASGEGLDDIGGGASEEGDAEAQDSAAADNPAPNLPTPATEEPNQQAAVVTPGSQPTAAPLQPGQATINAVAFTDDDGLFTSVFPANVSRFDNFVRGLDEEMVAESVTYAAAGSEIVAQVSRLRWQNEFAPVIPPMLDAIRRDPKPALSSELGQRLVSVLMGEGTRIDQVRRFDAFGRDAVELTGAIPDGDQGGHYSVTWLMPDGDFLFMVVLRAYDNSGLLGAEAAQFNQSFRLLAEIGAVPQAAVPEEPVAPPASAPEPGVVLDSPSEVGPSEAVQSKTGSSKAAPEPTAQ